MLSNHDIALCGRGDFVQVERCIFILEAFGYSFTWTREYHLWGWTKGSILAEKYYEQER